jgi:hypothetical protein
LHSTDIANAKCHLIGESSFTTGKVALYMVLPGIATRIRVSTKPLQDGLEFRS